MQAPKTHYTRFNYSLIQDIVVSADDNSLSIKVAELPPIERFPEYHLYIFINALHEASTIDDVVRVISANYSPFFTISFPLTDEWSCHITKGYTSLLSALFLAHSCPSTQPLEIDPIKFSDTGFIKFMTSLRDIYQHDDHPMVIYLNSILTAIAGQPSTIPSVDPIQVIHDVQHQLHHSFRFGTTDAQNRITLQHSFTAGYPISSLVNINALAVAPLDSAPDSPYIPVPIPSYPELTAQLIQQLAAHLFVKKQGFKMYTYLPFSVTSVKMDNHHGGLIQAIANQSDITPSELMIKLHNRFSSLTSFTPEDVLRILAGTTDPALFFQVVEFIADTHQITITAVVPGRTEHITRPSKLFTTVVLITDDYIIYHYPRFNHDHGIVPVPDYATPRNADDSQSNKRTSTDAPVTNSTPTLTSTQSDDHIHYLTRMAQTIDITTDVLLISNLSAHAPYHLILPDIDAIIKVYGFRVEPPLTEQMSPNETWKMLINPHSNTCSMLLTLRAKRTFSYYPTNLNGFELLRFEFMSAARERLPIEGHGTGNQRTKYYIQAITPQQAFTIRDTRVHSIFRRISRDLATYINQCAMLLNDLPPDVRANASTLLTVSDINIHYTPKKGFNIIRDSKSKYELIITVWSTSPTILQRPITTYLHGVYYEVHPQPFSKAHAINITACRSSFILSLMNADTPTVSNVLERLQELNFQLTMLHAIFILNRDPIISRFTTNTETPQYPAHPYMVYLIFDRHNLEFDMTQFIDLIRPVFPHYLALRTTSTLHGQPRYNDIFGDAPLEDRDRRVIPSPPVNPWNPPPPTVFAPPPPDNKSPTRRADTKSTTRNSDLKSTSRSTPSKLSDDSQYTQLQNTIATQNKKLSDMAHHIQVLHTRIDTLTLHIDPAANPFLMSQAAAQPPFIPAHPSTTFNRFSSLTDEFDTSRPTKMPTLNSAPVLPSQTNPNNQSVPTMHTSTSTPVPIRHASAAQLSNTQHDTTTNQSLPNDMDYWSDSDERNPPPHSPSQDL